MHESFLKAYNWRHLKLASALCIGASIAYMVHDPVHGPSGGTWLGYTLGTIGALLIVWLTWYGVRKRQFKRSSGTIRGWLSAHVYLGLSLIVIATLHAGFQISWNVHTLAYVLMMVVIASGFYGIIAYIRYPAQITENRADSSPAQMLAEIASLDEQALELADKIDKDTHENTLRSIQNTRIGGTAWQQVSGYSRKRMKLLDAAENMIKKKQEELAPDATGIVPVLPQQTAAPAAAGAGSGGQTMVFMTQALVGAGRDEKVKTLQQLLNVTARKKALVTRLNRDIQQRARLQIWLYLHVPLTVALLAALLIHIISVFLYW